MKWIRYFKWPLQIAGAAIFAAMATVSAIGAGQPWWAALMVWCGTFGVAWALIYGPEIWQNWRDDHIARDIARKRDRS